MTLSSPDDSAEVDAEVSIFLNQARKRPTDKVPIWFMRQAGRALPEYRSIRGTGSILEAVKNPELAAEITLQPVRRYGVDAAVLYSDIVVPIHAIDFGVEIHPGRGPVVENPFQSASDLKRFRTLEPALDIPYVTETIRLLTAELEVPLIGFAGAPFTIASYLIEGGPSKNFEKTKTLMLRDPSLWRGLMESLTLLTSQFLKAQLDAGVSAIQLFDSWAGALAPHHYRQFVLPYTKDVLKTVDEHDVPRVHFGVGTASLLGDMASAPIEVLGVDWRIPITKAVSETGGSVAIQGNLDPAVCLSDWETVKGEAIRILKESASAPGFIFNLGHGVLPQTDPKILEQLVEFVHTEGREIVNSAPSEASDR